MSTTPDAVGLPCSVSALLSALGVASVQVAVYDAEDRLVWSNPAHQAVFGPPSTPPLAFADMLRRNFAEQRGVRIDCGDVELFLRQVLPRRRSVSQRAFATDLVTGEWLWIHETLLPEGWLVSIGTDITQLKRLETDLRVAHDEALNASRTDALTGLSNRRWILELAESQTETALARGAPLALATIDLDDFKGINDSGAHLAGDAVLCHFADEATRFFRRGDIVGRPGGDEFLVVMLDADADSALAAVERFRVRLALAQVEAGVPRYTFSAGVATANADEDTQATLRRADRALYEAKLAGRACTRVAP